MGIDYSSKFESFAGKTLFERLSSADQDAVRALAFQHRFTYQEFRQVVEAACDLSLWGEPGIGQFLEPGSNGGRETTAQMLRQLHRRMDRLRATAKAYSAEQTFRPQERVRRPVQIKEEKQNIFGMCPVASPKTVCCNLRTIDAVENCVFGCSYCAVQTFYNEEITFDPDLARRLDAIELDPDRTYHIGTGQSSDSLAWGNKGGMLDALMKFAGAHPNVLLELKTKSDNVSYLLENAIPSNVVCSWSLNTPTIVANEEHFTATLDRRLDAARQVADRGVKVAFHFHPMVYYDRWRDDYAGVVDRILRSFRSCEVSFISLGSVTLIKPVIKQIRELGNATRINQMEMVSDPHGKLTYPDAIKVEMFSAMYEALAPWRGEVFTYLCMEKSEIWEQALGYTYPNNEDFERDFARCTLPAG